MKDSIIIDGKKFISVNRGSEITKYTKDYIGQLCRAGKVSTWRIGRNWLVDEASLIEHRSKNDSYFGIKHQNTSVIDLSVPQNENTSNTTNDIKYSDDSRPLLPRIPEVPLNEDQSEEQYENQSTEPRIHVTKILSSESLSDKFNALVRHPKFLVALTLLFTLIGIFSLNAFVLRNFSDNVIVASISSKEKKLVDWVSRPFISLGNDFKYISAPIASGLVSITSSMREKISNTLTVTLKYSPLAQSDEMSRSVTASILNSVVSRWISIKSIVREKTRAFLGIRDYGGYATTTLAVTVNTPESVSSSAGYSRVIDNSQTQYISNIDPTLLARITAIETAMSANAVRGVKQTDSIYDNIGKSISTAIANIDTSADSSFTTDITTTGKLTVSGTGTSTMAGGFDVAYINQTGTSATSTFASGINLTSGCFAVNGTCISSGSGGISSLEGVSLTKGYFLVGNDAGLSQATSSIFVSSTGNLGIGTTSPNWKLSVAGPGSFDDYARASYFTATSTTATSTFAGGFTAGNNSGFVVNKAAAANTLTVSSNGYVGIGTAAPAYTLDVSGNIRATGAVVAQDIVRVGAAYYIDFGSTRTKIYSSASGYLLLTNVYSNDFTRLQFGGTTASYPALSISTSTSAYGSALQVIGADGTANANLLITGLVGIGTTSPYAKLSVVGQVVGEYFTATSTTATSTFAGVLAVGTTTPGGNAMFEVGTSSPNLFVDKTNGYVGIGTAAPGAQLHLIKADSSSLTDLLVNPTTKTSGNLMDLQVNGSSKFSVDNTGALTFARAFNGGSGYTGSIGYFNALATNPSTTGAYRYDRTITDTGNQQIVRIVPTYNQSSGTAANTDLLINRTETAIGSGTQYLIDAQAGASGGVSKFNVTNTGQGYFAGNLGLGTTSPNWKLSVVGSGSFDDYVRASYFTATSTTATSTFAGGFTAGNNSGFVVNQAATANSLTVAANGNVGIGTVAPQASLDVRGSNGVILTGLGTTGIKILQTTPNQPNYLAFYDSGNTLQGLWGLAGSASGLINGSDPADMAFRTQGGSLLFSIDSGSTASMMLKNTGRVGIGGITSPLSTLSVYLAPSSSAGDTSIGLSYSTDGTDLWGFRLSATDYDFNIDRKFSTWQTPGLTIQRSTGNVGISTTSPNWKLSVAGPGSFDDYARASYFTATSTTATSTFSGVLAVGTTTPGGNAMFEVGTSSPNLFVDKTSGYVGIGTAAPGYKLDITAPSSQAPNLIRVNLSDYPNQGLFVDWNNGAKLAWGLHDFLTPTSDGVVIDSNNEDSNSGTVFKINGIEKMRISNLGNIGLGTTTPFSKLSVAGDTWLDSNIIRIGSTTASSLVMAFQAAATTTIPTNKNFAWTIATSTTADPIIQIDTTGSVATTTIGGRGSGNVTIGDSTSPTNLVFGASASILAGGNTITLGSAGDKFNFAVNVGIGSSTPFSSLTVASGNIGAFNGAICADNNGTAKCYASLTAGTVYGDASSFTASDIAENYSVADTSIETGDIVSIASSISETEQAKRSRDKKALAEQFRNGVPESLIDSLNIAVKKAQTGDNIIGVISTKPGVLLGDTTGSVLETTVKPIALSGRVPIKVNNQGGAIKAGDRIALSSISGVGMRATTTGQTIAIALEDFNGSSGKIMAFVSLNHMQSNLAADLNLPLSMQNNLLSIPTSTTATVGELSVAMSELTSRMSGAEQNISTIFGQISALSTTTNQIISSTTEALSTNQSFIESIATAVKKFIESAGDWVVAKITATLAVFTNIQTQGIETQTATIIQGMQITDQVTGQTYCVTLRNGDWNKVAGNCAIASPVISTPTPTPITTPTPTLTPTLTPTPTPELTPTPTISTTTAPTSASGSSVSPTPSPTIVPENSPTPAPSSTLTPSVTPSSTPESSPTPSSTPENSPAPSSSPESTPNSSPASVEPVSAPATATAPESPTPPAEPAPAN